MPVGSFLYRSQKYSDIDALQIPVFADCKDQRDLFRKFAQMVQNMVYRIQQNPDMFFSNFKTGTRKWSARNVQYGYLPLGEMIVDEHGDPSHILTLEQALRNNKIMNLEAWVEQGDRWMEVSNFFLPQYVDESGTVHNIVNPERDFINAVRFDVNRFYEENTFKSVKRLWILVRIEKKYELLNELQELLSSNAGDLYIILSDIKTLLAMIAADNTKLIKERNYDSIMNRLANIYLVDIPHEQVNNILFSLINFELPKDQVAGLLHQLLEILLPRLNLFTREWLAKHPNITSELEKYLH